MTWAWPIIGSLLVCLVVLGWRWRVHVQRLQAKIHHFNETLQRLEEEIAHGKSRGDFLESTVLEGVIDAIGFFDKDGKVQFQNAAFRKLFGVELSLNASPSLLELCRSHELQEAFLHVISDGASLEDQPLRQVRQGVSGHFCFSFRVVKDGDERVRGALLVIRDVGSVVALEDLRTEFVANVSHELRTPLSLIQGFVETLLANPDLDAETRIRFLRKTESHAGRLTALIEDLLTLSYLESGTSQPQPTLLPLRDELQSVLEDFDQPASRKSIVLHLEVPAHIQCHCDRNTLRQIVFNVVDNAIKYGREGGGVWVRWLQGDAPSRGVISIEDDGPGIPSASRDRIFERFYRVDQARSRAQGGTGLGLSIVKHLVRSLGGDIQVSDSKMGGACFTVSLDMGMPVSLSPVEEGRGDRIPE